MKKGGYFPMKYYNANYQEESGSEGYDRLNVSGDLIRSKIGGRRKSRKSRKSHKSHKSRKQTGGFIPSIMEGFSAMASKYITPLALFALHKLMERPTYKKRK